MRKKIKYILYIIGVAFIIFFGLIGMGIYMLGIEDTYGDLQKIYYKSETGDIIINRTKKEFGVLSKNWKSLNITTTKNLKFDLNKWGYKDSIEVYRPYKEIGNLRSLKYNDILDKINSSRMLYIENNYN